MVVGMALGERGRNPLRARSTAEAAASLRAAGVFERDATVRCPDWLAHKFFGGFSVTSLAKHRLTQPLFIRVVAHASPGTYPYMVARCRVVDEIVLSELAAGLEEVVLLGAGLDSLAYRLADALAGVRVFEVDHPASQASKQFKLRRIFGAIPKDVEFVAIDFAKEVDVGERLAAAGHDEGAATLFIWAGVSMYLAEDAVAAMLSWVSRHENLRTSIVFDACWSGAIDGSREYFGARQWRRGANVLGEPLQWGIPEGHVDETLAGFGLRAEVIYEPDDLAARHLVRQDGSCVGQPYGCAVIVHARPAGAASGQHLTV